MFMVRRVRVVVHLVDWIPAVSFAERQRFLRRWWLSLGVSPGCAAWSAAAWLPHHNAQCLACALHARINFVL